MADLNDIIINISMLTKPLSTKGFGLPLILGKRASGDADFSLAGIYNEYPDVASMTGFAAGSPEIAMATAMFSQSPRPEKVAVYIRNATVNIDAALTTLMAINNDWYALLITERDAASRRLAATTAAAAEKLFIGCSAANITYGAAADVQNDRSAYVIHNEASAYPEAAWVGMCLPQPIGSITWKWKSPSGVNASNFDTTVLKAIRDNNCQTFTKRSGVVYSNEGRTSSGEFIDNIQARDYVKAKLEEALFGLQIRNGKIPYDNSGFAMIESAMREVFKTCGTNGIIAKAGSEADAKKSDEGVYMYKIDMPERSEISANDRAARKIPGIKFAFTVAGAVHSMSVEGIIEV